ncbi:MAG: hypothetical protein ABI861_01835, partial [Panacibacter sp.]
MKKYLIISAIVLVTIASAFYTYNTKTVTTTENAVDKTIDMQVFAAANYSSPVYNGSNASLNVTITKIKDDKKEILWQMSYPALELKEFPENINAFKQKISIPAIFGKTTGLEINYTLTYNSNGSILQMKNTEA